MKLKFLAEITQFLLKGLPTCDAPVLNSCLFRFIWFATIFDSEQFTGLILPTTGTPDILSTFSQANQNKFLAKRLLPIKITTLHQDTKSTGYLILSPG
jgi:hypothetical protein